MASFGEELKRERELRDISLKEISEATKISIRFLEALEQNNFDLLPGGVFNRGFIRAYARFIGVDGEEMVNAYLHEVALREARQTQTGKGPQRMATPGVTGMTTPEPIPTSGELRAAKRALERASDPIGATAGSMSPAGVHHRGVRADSRAEIPPETRFSTFAQRSGRSSRASTEPSEARSSMGLWVLVVIAFIVGVGVIAMSLVGGKPVDALADGHAQALRARLSKKASPVAPAPESAASSQPQGEAAGEPQQDAAPAQPTASRENQTPVTSESTAPPTADNHDAGGATDPAPSPAPVVPEHRLRVRVLEVTRVVIECAGKRSLDEELWPGQSRALTCAEPVVLSAANGGAVEYVLDDGPAALLGQVGQEVEG